MTAPARLSASLAGAPLDIVKLVAAVTMVLDHTNKSLFASHSAACWYIGRLAYPMFALAIAAHLFRGTRPLPYIQRLFVLAVISQPAYSAALAGSEPNAVFTLAAGTVLATLLATAPRRLQHAAFAAGMIALAIPALHPHAGLDYGVIGTLYTAVLLLAIMAPKAHLAWLAALSFGLNYFANSWPGDNFIAFGVIALGGAATLWLALRFEGRPRFLPRYAFYAFYPGHLLVLALIKAALFQ
jgi:hypothetical protein